MKKSVLLMAGLLAMALAGSAQAANVMFAVQDTTGTIDKATIDDTGAITGSQFNVAGKIASGLANVPVVAGFSPIAGPAGLFHAASTGSTFDTAAFITQHVSTSTATATAPSFAFYRTNFIAGAYAHPLNGTALGYFNFGVINPTVDPNTVQSRVNLAQLFVKAEGSWAPGQYTNTPVFMSFSVADASTGTNVLGEKMRLSSKGYLGIGSNAPTSKLQVVGLPVCTSNTNATTAIASGGCGLTAGAFYLVGPSAGYFGGTALPQVTPSSAALQIVL